MRSKNIGTSEALKAELMTHLDKEDALFLFAATTRDSDEVTAGCSTDSKNFDSMLASLVGTYGQEQRKNAPKFLDMSMLSAPGVDEGDMAKILGSIILFAKMFSEAPPPVKMLALIAMRASCHATARQGNVVPDDILARIEGMGDSEKPNTPLSFH